MGGSTPHVPANHLLTAIEKAFWAPWRHTLWSTIHEQPSSHQVVTVVLPAANGKTSRMRQGSIPERLHPDSYETRCESSPVMPRRRVGHECNEPTWL